MAQQTEEIEVEGRRLRLSKRDKVLYPATGTTKGEVVAWYHRVAPLMLPHVAERALTRKRFPDGVDTAGFFEKNCPPYRPEWMDTVSVHSRRIDDKQTEYCVVHSAAGLVWLANLAAIELHPSLHLADDLAHPLVMVFDLDPGDDVGLKECVALARRIRSLLEDVGLRVFVKLSGGKGLHLWVPLRDATYEQTKPFAKAIARLLAETHPDAVTARMSKAERSGRIFIDWSQNDRNKTTVAAYSLRARDEPTISLPVGWDELLRARKPEKFRLTLHEALKRIERVDDPWQDLYDAAAPLPDAAAINGIRT
ncbi:MAG: non-homologous end-joining DNA ligase [Planctomycetota bacterium]